MTIDLFAPAQNAGRVGLGTGITELEEFNRRALIALQGVSFGHSGRAEDIVAACRARWLHTQPLSEKQQQALYNIVHRYRGQITDRLVTEYAATHAKGADA